MGGGLGGEIPDRRERAPTQKPVEVFARPMRKHTLAGEVCYEPFAGSGSQIIAAEKLHRKCRALEIAPTFVDVAIRRWEKATGNHATRGGDGRTYEDVAAEREDKGEAS